MTAMRWRPHASFGSLARTKSLSSPLSPKTVSSLPSHTLLWHRIAAVLLGITPRVRTRLARGDSTFARYLDHARRGAEMARDDGASERVVRLIARHHQRPVTDDEMLLARADREALP